MNTGCRWLAITLFLFLCQSTGPASSFHEVRSSHFTVRWSGASYTEKGAQATLREAEDAWNRCASFFGIRPPGRIVINLTDQCLPGTAITSPAARRVDFRRCHLSFLGLRSEYIVCHEVAHIFTSDWLGHGDSRKRGDMGPWSEGLADYVAGGFNGGLLQSWWAKVFKPYAGLENLAGIESFLSMAPMQYVPITLRQWRAHGYILTSLLIQHLVESRGRETFLRFYQALDSTWLQGVKDLQTALKTASHQTLSHPCEPLKLPEATMPPTIHLRIDELYQRFYGKTEKEVLDEWESVSEKPPIPSDESRRLIARFDQYVTALEMERRQPKIVSSGGESKASSAPVGKGKKRELSSDAFFASFYHRLPFPIIKCLEQARKALDADNLEAHERAMRVAREDADRLLAPAMSEEAVRAEARVLSKQPKTFQWHNLLHNADFETGLADWQGDGVLDNGGDAGPKCLRLTALRQREATASQLIPIEPDAWYLIAACMKSEGVRGQRLVVSWHRDNGKETSQPTEVIPVQLEHQWQRVERVVHAPKEATSVSMILSSGVATLHEQAPAWFDDVLVARVHPPMVTNRVSVQFGTLSEEAPGQYRPRMLRIDGASFTFRPTTNCCLWTWLQPAGGNERLWIQATMVGAGSHTVPPPRGSLYGGTIPEGTYTMYALLFPRDGEDAPWFAMARVKVTMGEFHPLPGAKVLFRTYRIIDRKKRSQ